MFLKGLLIFLSGIVVFNILSFLNLYLNPETKKFDAIKEEYDVAIQKDSILNSKITAMERAAKEFTPKILIIDELCNLKPENLYFNKIKIDEKKEELLLIGASSHLENINKYAEQIGKHRMVEKVNVEKISNSNRNSDEWKNFSIKVLLKNKG